MIQSLVVRSLLLLGCAVFAVHPVIAQNINTDTLKRAIDQSHNHKSDTTRARADSIQPRIGHDNVPPTLEVGKTYEFTRDELYASGALTLTDLLNRMTGVTTFQSGWIPSPQVVGYNGDVARIRVFYDGIELDNLEPRNGGVTDLRNVQLWSLERLSITRGANEIRVDIRSWEYNKTTPYTRVDVLTGDMNTNLYHAFYGKRFHNGAALQLAGEQYGVSAARYGGGGDELSLFGRYGVGRKNWSVDATVLRTRTTRTSTQRFGGGVYLPNYRASNTIAYLRAAVGREGDGPFAQFVASSQSLRENSTHFTEATAAPFGFPADTLDSLASLSQYVTTVGFDRWGGRVRLFDRYRTYRGEGYNSLGGTFDFTKNLVGVSLSAERDGFYGLTRVEAGARFTPFDRIALLAYVGQRSVDQSRIDQVDSRSARLEAGVRVFGDAWFSAGIVTRDTAILLPPIVFDSAYRVQNVGRTSGWTYSLRGPLKYGLSIDASGTSWGTPNSYTPNYQVRGEIQFATQWLSKFPNKNFGFVIAPSVEQRGRVSFPTVTNPQVAGASRIYSLRTELRILRGVISYQYRNIDLSLYEQVPGYLMPRRASVYGMRWYFFD